MINIHALNIICLLAPLIYLSFAITLAICDYKTGLLPDKLTLPLLWIGVIFHSVCHPDSVNNAIYGAISGYLSLWLIYWGFFWFTKREGLGYGDFKLLAAIGAWNGWHSLPFILVIASLTGIIHFLTLRIIRRKEIRQLPFGPYLAMAGWSEFFYQVNELMLLTS